MLFFKTLFFALFLIVTFIGANLACQRSSDCAHMKAQCAQASEYSGSALVPKCISKRGSQRCLCS